jgi:uncharacterized protein (TIGR02466 family)
MFDDLAAANVTQYHALFATPFLTADVPDVAELTGELRTIINSRRASHASEERSNKGGWQSDTGMLQWGGEPAQKLGALMIQMCGQFTTDIGQSDPNQPRFEWSAEMWANISPNGIGHESHTHPGALWSLVFYVDDGLAEADDPTLTGELVLQDPRNPTPVMYKPDLRYLYEDKTAYRSDHRFTPKNGQIVAFPSWVSHWVNPHRGSRERISIAMNTLALPARK